MIKSLGRLGVLCVVLLILGISGIPSATASTPDGLVGRWRQDRSWNSLLALMQYRLQNPQTFDDGTYDLDIEIGRGLSDLPRRHATGCSYLRSVASRYPGRRQEVNSIRESLCGAIREDDEDAAGVSGKADGLTGGGSIGSFLPFLPKADKSYRIESVASGLVLDVEGASQENGGHVIQYRWASEDNQRWRFEPLSGDDIGFYRITAVHSSRCLDVSEVSKADGAILHQWEYVGGDNQKWEIIPYARGVAIRAKHSGGVADVPGGSKQEGLSIQQFHEGGEQPNQLWRLIPS